MDGGAAPLAAVVGSVSQGSRAGTRASLVSVLRRFVIGTLCTHKYSIMYVCGEWGRNQTQIFDTEKFPSPAPGKKAKTLTLR